MVTSEWPTPEHPEWAPFLVRQVESLRKLGVDVTVFPFRGGGNPLNYARAWWSLAQRRLGEASAPKTFDLIHCQFGQSGLVVLPTPLPLVVTYHGSDLQGFVGPGGRFTLQGWLLRQASRFVSRFASANIVVSTHLGRYLPASARPVTIPCGINLEQFKPIPQAEARARLGLPLDQPLVAFVANPNNPIKRHPLALAAVAQLPTDLNAALLTVSGVSYADVPLYLNAADALLLTSRHEGSPTVIKEALACNLPVVSLDVGDAAERLAGIKGCVVCPEASPESLAAALEPILRTRQRTKGRTAAANFDEDRIAEKILEVYRRVVVSK